jgi:beta-galactosidase GanA
LITLVQLMKLGVCYYPEHGFPEKWASDAAEMRELGLSDVRIGEFAWSRIDPEPGRLEWGWLDEAIAILSQERLKIILGTPTATPPKWLVDRHPEMRQVADELTQLPSAVFSKLQSPYCLIMKRSGSWIFSRKVQILTIYASPMSSTSYSS